MHAVVSKSKPNALVTQELPDKDDGDLSNLLQELRVLLPGAQTLTAS